MKKISVIIPVYNVEPYIRKCLDSVVNQTYTNIEIICVDDGSTDNSGIICDEYAEKDTRFRVIHKTNGGYPSALNAGLDVFTGDYVGFVDPDDWIDLNFYEQLYRAIIEYEVDFTCVGWIKEFDKKNEVIKNLEQIEKKRIIKDDILKFTFIRDYYPAFGAYLWNKLFKSIFFETFELGGYNIRTREDLEVGCDVLLFTECALQARYAVYIESSFYHYFQRETSLFHSKDINKRMGSLKAYSIVLDLFRKNGIKDEISIWVKRFYVYHASLLAEISIKNKNYETYELMKNEINKYLFEYLTTNNEYPDRIRRIRDLIDIN